MKALVAALGLLTLSGCYIDTAVYSSGYSRPYYEHYHYKVCPKHYYPVKNSYRVFCVRDRDWVKENW